MANSVTVAAAGKAVLEDGNVLKPGSYSVPTRLMDPESGYTAAIDSDGNVAVNVGGASVTLTSPAT